MQPCLLHCDHEAAQGPGQRLEGSTSLLQEGALCSWVTPCSLGPEVPHVLLGPLWLALGPGVAGDLMVGGPIQYPAPWQWSRALTNFFVSETTVLPEKYCTGVA